MKKLLLLIVLTTAVVFGCSSSDDSKNVDCGNYNGHSLQKGEEGGCYYINSNGNKTYVDRSLCKC